MALELLETGRHFPNPLRKDLVGHWRMEEDGYTGAAGEVIDSSGNGNHGQAFNNATTTASGKLGRAATFDGMGDYINLGPTVGDYTDDFTIAAWIKTTVGGNRIISRRAWSSPGDALTQYDLYINGGTGNQAGQPRFYWGESLIGVFGLDFRDNEWHSLVVSINGASSKMYADGVLVQTFNPTIVSKPVDTLIGAFYGGSAANWNGGLDEMAIWDRALSADEVMVLKRLTDMGIDPLARDYYGLPMGIADILPEMVLADIRPTLEVVEV